MIDFSDIFASFDINGAYGSCVPHGSGLIHETFLLETSGNGSPGKYILQRMNTQVFRKPEAVQDNLRRILDHLKRERKDRTPDDTVDLELINARDGNNYMTDALGNYWRCFRYIEGSYVLENVGNPDQAYEGARLFGHFAARLRNYNPRRLHITIPDFLNIETRLRQLMIARLADPLGRLKQASGELGVILRHRMISRDYIRIQYALPERVTHNDTRISNILFNRETGKGLSITDLDTVMTGTLLTDFGDMVRTFTAEGGEEEKKPERIRCNPDLFRGVFDGFMTGAGGIIAEVEKANLLKGAKLMAYMQAVRFLTDFLNGDVYYKVTYPDQNLDRTKNQLKLLDSLLEQENRFQGIIDNNF